MAAGNFRLSELFKDPRRTTIDKIAAETLNAGFDTDTHQPVAVAPLKHPEPLATIDLPQVDDLDEYDRVASSLGFAPQQLQASRSQRLRHDVMQFCLDKGWPIFNNDEVQKYLQKLADLEQSRTIQTNPYARVHVVWAPLQAAAPVTYVATDVVSGSRSHAYSMYEIAPYSHPIPLDILKRAAALQERFGDAVGFYASDYQTVDMRPDPFIAVAPRGRRPAMSGDWYVVFGVWDEPGWGK